MKTKYDKKEFVEEITKARNDLEDIFPGSVFSIKYSVLDIGEEIFILRGGTDKFELTIKIITFFDFEIKDSTYSSSDLYKIAIQYTIQYFFDEFKAKHSTMIKEKINEEEIKDLDLRKQLLTMVYNNCEW